MAAPFTLVIPAINERDGLSRILPKLGSVAVIIVDDGSSDGTKELAGKFDNVSLLERGGKGGLVSACLYGMKKALETGAEYIAVMDGDGQHDPSYIDKMVREAEAEGADLVLGSRYLGEKGSGWEGVSRSRRLISRIANYIFRLSFGSQLADVTTGLRVYSRKAAEFLLAEPPTMGSYAGQVEIVEKLRRAGMKIMEYPIVFRKRVNGESKLSAVDIINYYMFVLTKGDLWKYTVVGLSGALVNELALWALAPLNPFVADLVAIELSITSNFLFNERWAFRGRVMEGETRTVGLRLVRHNLYSLVGLAINFLAFSVLTLAGMNPLLSNLFGIVAAFLFRYVRPWGPVWVEMGNSSS